MNGTQSKEVGAFSLALHGESSEPNSPEIDRSIFAPCIGSFPVSRGRPSPKIWSGIYTAVPQEPVNSFA
jgi:hypothetical protein